MDKDGKPASVVQINEHQLTDTLERLHCLLGKSQEPDSARSQTLCALHAVIDFIRHLPGFEGLDKPLLPLAFALHDAENGKAHPLLVPSPVSHRPPDARSKQLVRTTAAVAMELLMQSGERKNAAAARVSKALRKHGSTGHHGIRPSSSTVASWRERASDPHSNDSMAVHYREWLHQIETECRPIDAEIKRLLESAIPDAIREWRKVDNPPS